MLLLPLVVLVVLLLLLLVLLVLLVGWGRQMRQQAAAVRQVAAMHVSALEIAAA